MADFAMTFNNELDSVAVAQSATCEIEDCKNLLRHSESTLKVITQNIRSIHRNFPNFQTLLTRSNIEWDIIALTECWLTRNPIIPSIEGYKSFSTSNNQTQNEGVVIYCKNNYSPIIEEPQFSDANTLILKIDTDTILIAIYRPPGNINIDNFLISMNECLCRYTSFKNVILVGDINIDISPESQDQRSSAYLDMITFHGMLPAHTIPTRSRACLDHILLRTKLTAHCYVAQTSITDHDSVILFLNTKPKLTIKKTYDRIDSKGLNESMRSIDFSPIYNMSDVNLAADFFTGSISKAIASNTIAVTSPGRKRILKPWITKGLLRCMRNRDKLYIKSKKNPGNEIIQTTYKRYRNYCNNILKRAKIDYEKDMIKKAGNNNKKLWEIIKNITYTSKKNDKSTQLICPKNPYDSVNNINSFFAGIGRSLAEEIASNNANSSYTNTASSSRSTSSCEKSMVLLPTDESEIKSLIFNLKNDCAVGIDKISGKFLKEFIDVIVVPLTFICNLSFATGVFPSAFKKSQVVPVFKGGDRCCVNNYRPISILPTLSKILERLMNTRLVKFLETNRLLSSSQFGFRANKSTSDAVHQLTEFIISKLDTKKKTLAIYLDLAKAFDTVSIPILISKLEHLGVRGETLDLFANYLKGRSQVVKVNGWVSDELPIEYGVPQGSILGPTLFLVYINDLCNTDLSNGKVITFADDTALLFYGDTWEEVYKHAQNGLNTVSKWLNDNMLTVNVDKTKFMTYTIRKQDVPNLAIILHNCNLPFNSTCECPRLSKTTAIKYLGVLIDNRLNFQQHIEALVPRIRKLIYIFKSLRHIADTSIIKSVYLALCQSLLSYCITSWGGAARTLLLKLERAQRAILKVCSFLPMRYPTADLYKRCKVLTVRQLFILVTITKKHAELPYDPKTLLGKRRNTAVCATTQYRTSLAHNFYGFLGSYLYNNMNKTLIIYPHSRIECKRKVISWLQGIDYNATERLLKPLN